VTTLSQSQGVRPTAGSSVPKWWTRSSSAALAAIVVANVLLDFSAPVVHGTALTGLVIGQLLAQLFLMGLWLALGGLHFIVRFAVVTLVTLAGVLAAFSGELDISDELREFVVIGGMIVTGTYAIVVPLRWLLGWRIDFDRAYHATPSYGSMQIGLIHVLGMTTAAALPLGLLHFFPESTNGETKLIPFTFGATGLFGSFPVAMLVMAARRQRAWGLIAMAVLPSASYVESVTIDEAIGDGRALMWFANAGIAVTILFNLGVLRLVGLRLFSVKDPESPAKETGGNGMDVANLRRWAPLRVRPAFLIGFVICVGMAAFRPRLCSQIEAWFERERGGIPRLSILGLEPIPSGSSAVVPPPPTEDKVVAALFSSATESDAESHYIITVTMNQGDPNGSVEKGTIKVLAAPRVSVVENQEAISILGGKTKIGEQDVSFGQYLKVRVTRKVKGVVAVTGVIEVSAIGTPVQDVLEREARSIYFARTVKLAETNRLRTANWAQGRVWLELRVDEVEPTAPAEIAKE
jgi:hypothetical protein